MSILSDISKFSPLSGDWYIKELIGRGTYGAVYKAVKEDKQFGKTYISAIKHIQIPREGVTDAEIISEGLASDEATVTMVYNKIMSKLLNEIDTCYQLRGNSNIVSYEGHQVIPRKDGKGYDVFIRMEYLQSLNDYISKKNYNEKDVTKLGIDICNGLSVLNKRNIIHRDIKTANLFLNKDGVFKIGDFGEAKVLSQTTSSMSIRGTYTFMAPEIARGDKVNRTADIYSLGMVMYRMLNYNRPPFVPLPPQPLTSEFTEISNARRFKGEKLPVPAECKNQNLAEIILKACEYYPQNRWQTPEEFKDALENCLKGIYVNVSQNDCYIPNEGRNQQYNGDIDGTVGTVDANNNYRDFRYQDRYNINNNNNGPGIGGVAKYRGDARRTENYAVPKKDNNKALIAVAVVLAGVLIAIIVGAVSILLNLDLTSDSSSSSSLAESSEIDEENNAELSSDEDLFDEPSTVATAKSTSPTTPPVAKVKIPSCVNQTYDDARKSLENLGMVVRSEYENSDSVEKNKIIRQDYGAGTSLDVGSTVTLVVSKGPLVCPYEYTQKVTVSASGSDTSAKFVLYDWIDGGWEEKFSCNAKVGKNGIGTNYGEGKSVTPQGIFKLGVVLSPSTPNGNMPYYKVSSSTCVVDDVNSPLYNTICDSAYVPSGVDIDPIGKTLVSGNMNACIFIEHNGDGYSSDNVTPGMGSVITVCGCNYTPKETLGCIDITASDMNTLLSLLDNNKNPHIEMFSK